MPWYTEDWSRGILLGLDPDPNTGYRATIWFEYTRALFNQIREGSLVAVRNFNDRARNQPDHPGERTATYEEYSILQIDQVHPWHYAIQGSGDRGYPAFNVAAAESARRDWVEWDEQNRDDVTRIRCEAIPLRLAFVRPDQANQLPSTFPDRSKPMPGYEVRVLRPAMTQAIINHGLVADQCIHLGTHLVQPEVAVNLSVPEMLSLHFGVFGFTGAGKSNLLSTVVRECLTRQPSRDGRSVFKMMLFDLMDEYTGLVIDQLSAHPYSQLIICGRETVDEVLYRACQTVAADPHLANARTQTIVGDAARAWAERITLPAELRSLRQHYVGPLAELIRQGKVRFYEPLAQQGQTFNIDSGTLLGGLGARAYGDVPTTQQRIQQLRQDIDPLLQQARQATGQQRDGFLEQIIQTMESAAPSTDTGRRAVENAIRTLRQQTGTRGPLANGISVFPAQVVGLLNYQPLQNRGTYQPSLTVVIGEHEEAIASFARQIINDTFRNRRENSLLYPMISFVFDEADVFVSQQQNDSGNLVAEAALLARRGRKFGLGLGISTQRIIYLDTSIMAQPHTYFISKLPRQSDRQRIAEAFAISEESLEQSFSFTAGQWLVASHDATGLKGTPFPVQLPNANHAIRAWLETSGQRANQR
jgi:hypothetical protein